MDLGIQKVYSDGSWDTRVRSGGKVRQRHPMYPIPLKDLLGELGIQIVVNAENWEQQLTTALQNHGFRVTQLHHSLQDEVQNSKDCGPGYVRLVKGLVPNKKQALRIAVEATILFAPGLNKCVRGGWKGKRCCSIPRRIFTRSFKQWWAFLKSWGTLTAIGGSIAGGAYGCKRAYDAIVRTKRKYSNFVAWRTAHKQTFLGARPIPEKWEEDEVLCENECPITFEPIRYPSYHVAGANVRHRFEEYAIKAWLQGHESCPLCRQNLTVNDLVFDTDLSDRIEKRLLWLSLNDQR